MLIGEPGVGKTAIVEGLAQKIVNGDVPTRFSPTSSIYTLDLGSLVAGTKYRGAVRGAPQEGHEGDQGRAATSCSSSTSSTPWSAPASAEGAIDAASILKPMLSRGELQTIGATTPDEYRKHIEKDGRSSAALPAGQGRARRLEAHTIEII